MPADALLDSRTLVRTCITAQAQELGLWQQHRQMAWWQGGVQAMGANVVVDCGTTPDARQLSRLAQLFARMPVPAAWLVWPDQNPELQAGVLHGFGFQFCEGLWLARLTADQLLPLPAGLVLPDRCVLRPLKLDDRPALADFYEHCHQIPAPLAWSTASAFLSLDSPSSSPGWFSTVGVVLEAVDGCSSQVVAAISSCFCNSDGLSSQAPLAGLVWLGTHSLFRRKGLARWLTHHVCSALFQRGLACINVQAAPVAVELYRGLGFRSFGQLELWARHP
jgi:GNAT superfamily N-acetyltransferase